MRHPALARTPPRFGRIPRDPIQSRAADDGSIERCVDRLDKSQHERPARRKKHLTCCRPDFLRGRQKFYGQRRRNGRDHHIVNALGDLEALEIVRICGSLEYPARTRARAQPFQTINPLLQAYIHTLGQMRCNCAHAGHADVAPQSIGAYGASPLGLRDQHPVPGRNNARALPILQFVGKRGRARRAILSSVIKSANFGAASRQPPTHDIRLLEDRDGKSRLLKLTGAA